MKRMPAILWLTVSTLAAGGCGSGATPDPLLNKSAPDFTVVSLPVRGKSGEVKLSQLRGKVVLLDFWATWCQPCRSVMPDIQSLYDDYAKKGLQILAISNEDLAQIVRFRASSQLSYPMFQDASGDASTEYSVDEIPTAVVIDRNGKVVFHDVGTDPEAVRNAVESAIGQSNPTAN